MLYRSTIILTISIFVVICCRPAPRSKTFNIPEKNKDVLILATLISDELRRTKSRTLMLDKLVEKDTLNRIKNNFEKLELVSKGGHISIYYKFSNLRDTTQLSLTDSEKKRFVNWTARIFDGSFDGEIQVAYGERFYHLKKIIVKK